MKFLYQSSDCTGSAYISAGPTSDTSAVIGPTLGHVAMLPPATQPSIYFAGTPAPDDNEILALRCVV
jgi:hypothetical protein